MTMLRDRFFLLLAIFLAVTTMGCSGRVYYDTPPLVPIPVQPSTATELASGASVRFIWRESETAELYDFHIFDRTTGDIQRYFRRNLRSTDVCKDGMCSIDVTVVMPVDNGHAWRVRSFNSAGYSSWSRSVFKITP